MLKFNFNLIVNKNRCSLFFFLLGLFFANIQYTKASDNNKKESATEIRAVWLTTNWQLDWPKKGKSVEQQKQELIDILDNLKSNNFNLVLFQARAQARSFYNSTLEAKSPFFNHDNHFDPLAFAIDECHKRQMECHAWLTVFPAERISNAKNKKTADKKPDYYKAVKGYWYLDPGRPETKTKIVSIVSEITSEYDVDGIHLDYVRYPDQPQWLNDNDTFKKYGAKQNKEAWRRSNVNEIVSNVYDAVKSIKPWVQVSTAPIGKYNRVNKKDDWTAFDNVYQDPKNWVDMKKQDILFPMMYYPLEDLKTHYDNWIELCPSRYVVPGIATYKLNDDVNNWDLKEIESQINFLKDKKSMGIGYFRTDQLSSNTKQLNDYLHNIYKYPAKLPPLVWLRDYPNETNVELSAFLTNKGNLKLEWETIADSDESQTYSIYVSETGKVDIDNPANLLVTNYRGNSIVLHSDRGEYGLYYFITASNRYHIESKVSESVFFVHSESYH